MAIILHAINVSTGDATLLQVKEPRQQFNVLIDGGEDKSTVQNYLKKIGIKRLDVIVASHIDYDHIRGLLEVIRDQSISIGEFWVTDINIFRDFLQTGVIRRTRQPSHILYSLRAASEAVHTLNDRGVQCRAVYEGYSTNLGDVRCEVLYPPSAITDFLTSESNLRRILRLRGLPPSWLPPDYPLDWAAIQELVEKRLEDRKVTYNIEPWDLHAYLREHQYPSPENLDTPPDAQQEGEESDLSYFESQHLVNDTSVVLKISYGNKTLLFPGDLTNWTYVLVKHAEEIRRVTVFKVPHHGSYIYDFGYGITASKLTKFYDEFWHRYGPFPPFEHVEEWPRYCRALQGNGPRQSSVLYSVAKPEVVLMFPRGRYPKLPYYETRAHLSRLRAQVLCTRDPQSKVKEENSCLGTFGCRNPSVRTLTIYKRRRMKMIQGICGAVV